ncbi:MAG: hypothetical protein ACJ74O_15935 [Frankiaceae bacterium]
MAYVPHADSLAMAVQLARGGALRVVETVGFPICGWANETGALNLLTRDGGHAVHRRRVQAARGSGFDDLAALIGYAGARGKSSRAPARLRALALSAGFREPTADNDDLD